MTVTNRLTRDERDRDRGWISLPKPGADTAGGAISFCAQIRTRGGFSR